MDPRTEMKALAEAYSLIEFERFLALPTYGYFQRLQEREREEQAQLRHSMAFWYEELAA